MRVDGHRAPRQLEGAMFEEQAIHRAAAWTSIQPHYQRGMGSVARCLKEPVEQLPSGDWYKPCKVLGSEGPSREAREVSDQMLCCVGGSCCPPPSAVESLCFAETDDHQVTESETHTPPRAHASDKARRPEIACGSRSKLSHSSNRQRLSHTYTALVHCWYCRSRFDHQSSEYDSSRAH